VPAREQMPVVVGDQPADRENSLELRQLAKSYGEVQALRGVNLNVRRGEFLTVLGPSGSGKTTILKLVAGFILPTSGQILLDGRDVSHMTPAERAIGMVFQQYALFPHMSVHDNIAYGLKMRRWSKPRRDQRIEEMLELVGLSGMAGRLPRELSGGQQQRVALARALAFGPTLLLMDEPLGALDRELRIRMAAELRRIHRELSTTIVYVTHDREEALTLSDRIAIMHVGDLEAVDTPQNLYTRPTSRFVAGFFAGHNLVPARLISTNGSRAEVECLTQRVQVEMGASLEMHADVWLAVPSQAIGLERHGVSDLSLTGCIVETLYLGEVVQLTCAVDGVGLIQATLPYSEAGRLDIDANLRLHVDATRMVAVGQTVAHREADRGGTT
jgi:ABC-type Fe3+/spermidine/putrescine transport system ATPase subunit